MSGEVMEAPQVFDAVNNFVANDAIGLVQSFFLNRLQTHNDKTLVEDDDLPVKQRFPKPRLPPTGKITSPRKRPVREQQQLARKKRKLEEGREEVLVNGVKAGTTLSKPVGKLKLDVPPAAPPVGDPTKEEDATGMMSPPESL